MDKWEYQNKPFYLENLLKNRVSRGDGGPPLEFINIQHKDRREGEGVEKNLRRFLLMYMEHKLLSRRKNSTF